GELWCERQSVWECYPLEVLTLEWARSLATAVAKYSERELSEEQPLLSAQLPDGERVQVVLPPACELGTVSLTIPKPSYATRPVEDYQRSGFFDHVLPPPRPKSPEEDLTLWKLYESQDYVGFLRQAVWRQKVIVVAGETGSGKTTFMKALM